MSTLYDELKKMVPKEGPLQRATLQAMRNLKGPVRYRDVAIEVGKIMNLPEDVIHTKHQSHSPATVLSYEVQWALDSLHKANLVENTKPYWELTEAGLKVDQAQVETLCKQAKKEAAKQARDHRAKKQQQPSVKPSASMQTAANRQNQESVEAQLLDRIAHLDSIAFSKAMRAFLAIPEQATGNSRSPNGENGWVEFEKSFQVMQKIKVRVSIWCGDKIKVIGEDEIQAIADSVDDNTDKIVILSVGEFSEEAKKLPARLKAKRIRLVDGPNLARLMRESGMGIKTVETTVIDPSFFKSLS